MPPSTTNVAMTSTLNNSQSGRPSRKPFDRAMGSSPSQSVGIILAAATVLCWASFNVAAKYGIDHGIAPANLSFLRFGTAGLLLIPAMIFGLGRGQGWPSLQKIALLALFGGPLFGFVAVSGYLYAPLSHGLLFAPASVLLVGSLLGWLALREPLGRNFLVGSAVVIAGLTVLSGFDVASLGPQSLLGDGLFACAGAMWATFTVLMRHWRIDPIAGTVSIGSVSAILSIPVLLVFGDVGFSGVDGGQLVLQTIMQGLVGGILSVVLLLAAVRSLGAARASLLPAMTPGVAMVLSFLIFGTVASAAEITGIVLVTIGLAVAVRRAKAS